MVSSMVVSIQNFDSMNAFDPLLLLGNAQHITYDSHPLRRQTLAHLWIIWSGNRGEGMASIRLHRCSLEDSMKLMP